MMRRSTLLSLVLAILLGSAVFAVKYQVLDLERDVTKLNRDMLETREAIHVLAAEWSYLNQPDRLRRLVDEYLPLVPLAPDQVIAFDDLPRPADDDPSAVATPFAGDAPLPDPARTAAIPALPVTPTSGGGTGR